MEIKVYRQPFELHIKRCYLPIELHTRCEECGSLIEKDISDDYLSYPCLNEVIAVNFYCLECDSGQEGRIKISLQVKEVKEA